jgi:putative peptidoglycan lipid II flippase
MDRVKKFWYFISNKKLTISSAAIILGATSLISNILGLYRERMIAATFGAGHMTDAFYASFKLPDLIFNLLILGALSSAFIPVFVERITEKDKSGANEVANSFLNFIILGAGLFGVIIFIAAPQLVPFLLPGFFNRPMPSDFNLYELTVNLTRIMILSPIFFSISAVFGGILNSYKRFVAYSLAPIIYNISIIISIVYFREYFTLPVYALTAGVIVGAIMHALIQLPSVLSTGYRWRPYIDLKAGQIARIFKLMVPRTIAIGVGQINLLIDTIIASFFIGGITVLNFANNIQTTPTVIFGISISTAIFPVLTENYCNKNMKEFMKNFSWSARRILYFMIPASIGIIILRAQIVRLIYGIGSFSWDNTYWTTKALLFFAVGLVAQALVPLLVRAFYAIQDTRTPLFISFVVMLVNAGLSFTLPFIPALDLGVAGIALAFTISGFVNVIMLFVYLHNKIGALDPDHKIFESTARLIISSVLMGLATYGSLYLFDVIFDTSRVVGLLAQTGSAILVGAASYFVLTILFKCEESIFILNKLGHVRGSK